MIISKGGGVPPIQLMKTKKALFLAGALVASPTMAQDAPPPPEQDTESSTGVSLVSGGYSTGATDLKIGTGEFPQALVLGRQYSSSLNKQHGIADGLMGWGWTASTIMFITVGELGGGDYPPDEPPVTNMRYPWRYGIVEGASTLASFVEQDPNTDPIAGPNYEGPFQQWSSDYSGAFARVGDDLIFVGIDGTRHIFEGGTRQTFRDNIPTFRTRLEAPDGTILTFDGDLGTKAVFSNRGIALLFELDTDNRTWTKACAVNLTVHEVTPSSSCPSGVPFVAYQHAPLQNTFRKMTAVTDTVGNTVTYGYTAEDQLDCIKLPGQSACQVRNYYTNCIPIPNEPVDWSMNAHQQVYRQDFITGEYVTYSFDMQRYCPAVPPHTGNPYSAPSFQEITMTYSDGSTKMVKSSYEGLPLRIVDGLGRETTMVHGHLNLANRPTKLTQVHAEDGNTWLYSYAMNGLVRKTTVRSANSGDPDLVWETDYGPCAQPIMLKDARGNVTDMEYSTVHCGLLKKTLPADDNGIRPQTRYSYVQKHAWIKSGGGYAQVADPVWVLASEEFCRTSAADANGNCAAGAGDKVVTTYEYQEGNASRGSNVWLVGIAVTADGITQRSCISYDEYGRKVSETSPRAGLASCQ